MADENSGAGEPVGRSRGDVLGFSKLRGLTSKLREVKQPQDSEQPREVSPNRGGLLDRWNAMMEEPVSRRLVNFALGTGIGLAGAEYVGSKLGISPLEILKYGDDAEKYFTTIPKEQQTEFDLATKEAVYEFNNGRDKAHYGDGDSIGAGYFEVSHRDPEARRQMAFSQMFSTQELFARQAKALVLAEDPKILDETNMELNGHRWDSENDSHIGRTSDQAIASIREKIAAFKLAQENIDDDRRRGAPEDDIAFYMATNGLNSDWTWDISMGGNDLIYLFADHKTEMAAGRLSWIDGLDYRLLTGLQQEFTGHFLPKFTSAYTETLKYMLSEAAEGFPMQNLKRIFVRGLPNGFEIKDLNPSQLGDRFKDLGSLTLSPSEQQIVGILTLHMNNAIKKAIEDAVTSVREQYPDAQIPDVFFESIDDADLDGMHPSQKGYKEMAKWRLERCVADFSAVMDESGNVIVEAGRRSFWEQAELTGSKTELLQDI